MTAANIFPPDARYPERAPTAGFAVPQVGPRSIMDICHMVNRRVPSLLGGIDLVLSGKPASELPGMREILEDAKAIMSRIARAYGLSLPRALPISRMRVKKALRNPDGTRGNLGEWNSQVHAAYIYLDDSEMGDPTMEAKNLMIGVHEWLHALGIENGPVCIREGMTEYLTRYINVEIGLGRMLSGVDTSYLDNLSFSSIATTYPIDTDPLLMYRYSDDIISVDAERVIQHHAYLPYLRLIEALRSSRPEIFDGILSLYLSERGGKVTKYLRGVLAPNAFALLQDPPIRNGTHDYEDPQHLENIRKAIKMLSEA